MIFIALGSSIGNSENIFASTEKHLKQEGITILQKSKIFKNPPLGNIAKNEFSNAVWEIKINQEKEKRVSLQAETLLSILKNCEIAHGRDIKNKKWSDRPLDLDILMFNDLILKTKSLTIPHKEIPNRIFVLKPWSELVDQDFNIPKQGSLQKLLKGIKSNHKNLSLKK